MWRYLACGAAALLMIVAGWTIFSGAARTEPLLPPAPQAAADGGVGAASGQADDTPVPEASARTREEKRFDRYDKDRDAKITRDEYLGSRRKAFVKLDANADGRLSFEEWALKTTDKFAGADRDKSGTMDRAEFAATAVKRKAARPTCVCPAAAPADDDN